jgi:hypothetical protein
MSEAPADKNAWVRSYLDSQRIYTAARAVQGPRNLETQSHSSNLSPSGDSEDISGHAAASSNALVRAENDAASVSVLLRPRAPAPLALDANTQPARPSKEAPRDAEASYERTHDSAANAAHEHSGRSLAPTRKSQPRKNMENSDPEYAARTCYLCFEDEHVLSNAQACQNAANASVLDELSPVQLPLMLRFVTRTPAIKRCL